MTELSDWLRSGVSPIEPLDTAALVRHAHKVQRRRRQTRIAATAAVSSVCLAGAALLARSDGGERHDLAVTGPGPSTEADGPCGETGVGFVSWPEVTSSTGADAVELADQFSTDVLGTDGTAQAEVVDSPSGCVVVVDHGSVGRAGVLVQATGDQLVVAGYEFPMATQDADVGLGLSAVGSTVRVNLGRPICPGCTAHLAVRYGDAQAAGPLDPTGEGTVRIDRDMTVPGTALTTVLDPNGTIVEAVGVTVPSGDFAAG